MIFGDDAREIAQDRKIKSLEVEIIKLRFALEMVNTWILDVGCVEDDVRRHFGRLKFIVDTALK